MFCPVYPRPVFITQNPDASADLSWADVTEGAELKQEVVVGEGHLGVGHAAVVTWSEEGSGGGETREALIPSDSAQHAGHRLHSHELWSRKSPEPSQFRKSPVSARTNRHV